ncbi:MAG: GAF domain-containing protein, partial [Phycisphaerae bacterium]|nr:GAF domain-containing protein [Phycisphaerae bacterium]
MNNTTTYNITETHMRQFNQLAHKLNRLGLNLLVFDRQNKCILRTQAGEFDSDIDELSQTFAQNPCAHDSPCWFSDRLLVSSVCDETEPAAMIVVDTGNIDSTQTPHERKYLTCIVEDWLEQVSTKDQVSRQIEKISNELSQAYEEIILLYNLSTNMKVTQTNSTYLQMACDQLTQLIHVEGIAIFVERRMDGHKELVLMAGSGFLTVDAGSSDILQMHLISELSQGKEALLDSRVDGPFKYAWPEGVKNMIAVPLGDVDNMVGFLVATNMLNKPDFDTTDIKLFNSVANQCRVFIENNHLFDDLKELFIGSLKALTNSIDAKDQYTRGHSE